MRKTHILIPGTPPTQPLPRPPEWELAAETALAAHARKSSAPSTDLPAGDLRGFLTSCLDARVVDRVLSTLEQEEVLCVDDLQLFQQLPRFTEALTAVSAEKITRALDIRTAASNAHEPEPEWLAEASSHLSQAASQVDLKDVKAPPSDTAYESTSEAPSTPMSMTSTTPQRPPPSSSSAAATLSAAIHALDRLPQFAANAAAATAAATAAANTAAAAATAANAAAEVNRSAALNAAANSATAHASTKAATAYQSEDETDELIASLEADDKYNHEAEARQVRRSPSG